MYSSPDDGISPVDFPACGGDGFALADLGVASGDHLQTTHYAPPAKRSKGVMVKDVAELVNKLKTEAGVL